MYIFICHLKFSLQMDKPIVFKTRTWTWSWCCSSLHSSRQRSREWSSKSKRLKCFENILRQKSFGTLFLLPLLVFSVQHYLVTTGCDPLTLETFNCEANMWPQDHHYVLCFRPRNKGGLAEKRSSFTKLHSIYRVQLLSIMQILVQLVTAKKITF